MYTWSNRAFETVVMTPTGDFIGAAVFMSVTDVTTGDVYGFFVGDFFGGEVHDALFNSGEGSITDSGTLTFSQSGTNPAPEPGATSLIVVGIGALVARRKLYPHRPK